MSVILLNNKLNGCSLEQEGKDFYIIGADSVRKKLGSGNANFYKIHSQLHMGKWTEIECGFKPNLVIMPFMWGGNSAARVDVYNFSRNEWLTIFNNPGSGGNNINPSGVYSGIPDYINVNDTGFRIQPPATTYTNACFYAFG